MIFITNFISYCLMILAKYNAGTLYQREGSTD